MNTSIHYNIQHFETLDSTNKEVLRQAEDGADEGLVVIAKHQTSGKGRLGRTWHTINHALAMSILLRPDVPITDVSKLSLVTAVALYEALAELAPNIGIKWPNDLLADGKKVSGILTEMRSEGTQIKAVVLGIGVNVSAPEQGWPKDIQQPATDLQTLAGTRITQETLVAAILASINTWYIRFLEEGFAPVHHAWWQAHIASGQTVSVFDGNSYIKGTAHALAEDGALIVLVNGVEQRIIAGDVSLMDL